MTMEHKEQIAFLKKIEGQIRGVQKMIEDKRYCVDILIQLQSIAGAIFRVEDKVFERHLQGCVTQALRGKSDADRQKKVDEILVLLKKFRKRG
ncbi:MAG: metal-sensitive transcriptional regulator [Candidatus Omnitrophica bacterium]|nr:metal-sensitive transcriptional regulator [Candidatus Omnitrophota bacterium]